MPTKKRIISLISRQIVRMLIVSVISLASAHTAFADTSVQVESQVLEKTDIQNVPTNDQLERAALIDSYYARYDLPLKGYGLAMVLAADKYDIDWRLLPAISLIESTGGKFACKKATFSAFGWGSCHINFSSYEEAIDVISKNLGGFNPVTSRHYADKDTRGILRSYNPPSIVPDYADKVMRQMSKISPNA